MDQAERVRRQRRNANIPSGPAISATAPPPAAIGTSLLPETPPPVLAPPDGTAVPDAATAGTGAAEALAEPVTVVVPVEVLGDVLGLALGGVTTPGTEVVGVGAGDVGGGVGTVGVGVGVGVWHGLLGVGVGAGVGLQHFLVLEYV